MWEEKPDPKNFRSNLDVNVSLYFFLPPSLPLLLSSPSLCKEER